MKVKAFSGFSVSPGNLDFGTVIIGASSNSECITFTNTGNVTLFFSNIQIIDGNGQFAFTSSKPNTIPVGGSANVCLDFTPSGSGSQSTVLHVDVIGWFYFRSMNIPISGRGGIPQASVFASPEMINFGNVEVGSQSDPQCITLSNTGGLPVMIVNSEILYNSFEDISFTSEFSTVIPIQGSTNICLKFAPQSTGIHGGYLHLECTADYGALDTDIYIPVYGTGVAPFIELAPVTVPNTPTMLFVGTTLKVGANSEQCMQIRNTGTSPLIINGDNTVIANDLLQEFSITQLPTNAIQPGDVGLICIKYSCKQEARSNAVLEIRSNAINGDKMVGFAGRGIIPRIVVVPNSITIDSLELGSRVCQYLQISNPGSDTLWYRNYFSSNDGDFSMQSDQTARYFLAPGASTYLTVCFAPIQEGSRQARVTFTTNIPTTFEQMPKDTGMLNVTLTGTGIARSIVYVMRSYQLSDTIEVGQEQCEHAQIVNLGATPATITAAELGPNDGMDIRYEGLQFPLTIAPRSKVEFTVCVSPNQRGNDEARIRFFGEGKQTGQSFSVYGGVYCGDPEPLSFFENMKVIKNGYFSQKLTVTNCGDFPQVYSATVSGDGYQIGNFQCIVSAPIWPGERAEYDVQFHPTTMGIKPGNILIQGYNMPDITIPLSGEGACSVPEVGSFEIPATAIGSASTFYVIVSNNGNYDWNPGTPFISPSGAFSVVSSPSVIAANQSGVYTLKFEPAAYGLTSALMTFPEAGPCQESDIGINLTGNAVMSQVKEISAEGFSLEQNYPNPASDVSMFGFTIPKTLAVRIDLIDMKGNLVKQIVDAKFNQGYHSVSFSTRDLASGTYLYKLESANVSLTRALIIQK